MKPAQRIAAVWILLTHTTFAATLSDNLATVRAVGPEGLGNAAAGAAWKSLAAGDASSLPALLGAMDGANDLVVNWLRAAVETIAGRAGPTGSLPLKDLEIFARDTRHHPRARRLACDLIARSDPAAAQNLLAGFLNDPGPELRREAVQQVIDEGARREGAGDKAGAIPLYEKAIAAARAVDQINTLSTRLKALGHPVELANLFGFLIEWQVVGPFDSTGGKGFDAVYPPETTINLRATYDGKAGRVGWTNFISASPYGVVDLNQPLGALKGVAGYAFTKFNSAQAQPVELRLGSENAWKIWLNGKLIFGREEYHRGMEIDQYRLPVTLRTGVNTLLVKLCQNEMVEDWTKKWDFQLRITDAQGTPVKPAAPANVN